MENRRQVARTLLIVGMLLLPAPLYYGVAADAILPAPRATEGYVAEPVDLDTESGIDYVVRLEDRNVAVSEHDFYKDPAYPHQWNTSTWRVLETAITNGSATVSDSDTRAELQEITVNHQFVRETSDDKRGYYRLIIEQNATVVRTDPVSHSVVASAIVDQAPHYENLTTDEKQTVDEILNASVDNSGLHTTADYSGPYTTADYSGFHIPRVNDAFIEEIPTTIWKGDSLYRLKQTVHIDRGISQSGIETLVGFGLSVIGLVLAVLGWRMGKLDSR